MSVTSDAVALPLPTIPQTKRTYPFGTPFHGKHAYSEFAHLTAQNKDFAMHINNEGSTEKDMLSTIHSNFSDVSEPKSKPGKLPKSSDKDKRKDKDESRKEKDLPPSLMKKMLVSDLQSEEGLKPCMRPECKDVISAIIVSQEKNRKERERITAESKHLISEIQQVEQLCALTDSEQKLCISEGAQLEKNLIQLGARKDTLERTKQEQAKERDELNNKVNLSN